MYVLFVAATDTFSCNFVLLHSMWLRPRTKVASVENLEPKISLEQFLSSIAKLMPQAERYSRQIFRPFRIFSQRWSLQESSLVHDNPTSQSNRFPSNTENWDCGVSKIETVMKSKSEKPSNAVLITYQSLSWTPSEPYPVPDLLLRKVRSIRSIENRLFTPAYFAQAVIFIYKNKP